MQSRLTVKNFGPIEFVDLDLRNVNVFIGPQASGKSALAKLYTIFKAPRKFLKNGNTEKNIKAFKEVLEEYNIASFLKEDSEIEFDSELHALSYKIGVITYEPKLLKRIQELEKLNEDFESNRNRIIEGIVGFRSVLQINYLDIIGILGDFDDDENPMESGIELTLFANLNKENFSEIINAIKEIEINLTTNAALYIPSERNFSNIIKKASLNLILSKAPIPGHILFFGAELEKIDVGEIKLDFLQKNLIYKSINGEDRIFTDTANSIKLTEAASGVQSVLPILMPVLSHDPDSFQRSFVIEEPELNLFPIAQYGLIKLLESTRQSNFDSIARTIHTYTTHSPYILSAFNNLLYAYKASDYLDEKNNERKIQPIINSSSKIIKKLYINPSSKIINVNINPDSFTVYQINNGKAESIFDRETGLIKDNYIDEASDKMADDFDALMDLMK